MRYSGEFRPCRPRIRLSAALLGAMLWAALPPALHAEDNPESEATAIDEIVVTATGFGERRTTHPGNIAKISSDEVDFVAAQQPAELLNRAPGVAIQQGSGAEHLTAIRSPVLTGTAGAGSFLYLEDGVPMRAAGFANVNELLEAMVEESGGIEIVRGPGSALYGSNAEHGLVNVLSRPSSETPEGSLTGEIGPHGSRNLNGTASAGVRGENGTSHGLRASFALAEDHGFRASSGYGQQKGQLRYDFSGLGTTIRATVTAVNLNQETAGFVSSFNDRAIYKSNPNPEAYRDAWAVRGAVRIERDLGDGRKLALTPYARTNGMNFLMHFQPGQPVEKNSHWSGGLLGSYALTLGGGHQIILGLDTEYTEGELSEIQSGPTVPGGFVNGAHYDYEVNSLVVAPYLHTVWKLGERTDLTVGLRYEVTRYDYRNKTSSGLVGRFLRPDDRVDTFANPTPKIGLTHIFSDEIVGFANLARAARAPQTADLYRLQTGQNPRAIDPEELDSIEIGARGRIARLRYEVSAYFMKKRNFAFRDAAGDNITDGKTEHKGVEAEIATPLWWNFDLAASASYAHHTYDFNDIIANPGFATETIRSGDDIDTAPHTVANVRLGYVFDRGRGRGELEWVHLGAYWMDPSNTVRYPGHNLFNLRADYRLTDNFAVFAKLKNIFDKRFADRADFFCRPGSCTQRFFPGEDRAFYVGTSVSF